MLLTVMAFAGTGEAGALGAGELGAGETGAGELGAGELGAGETGAGELGGAGVGEVGVAVAGTVTATLALQIAPSSPCAVTFTVWLPAAAVTGALIDVPLTETAAPASTA